LLYHVYLLFFFLLLVACLVACCLMLVQLNELVLVSCFLELELQVAGDVRRWALGASVGLRTPNSKLQWEPPALKDNKQQGEGLTYG
jgi:hypothetical protein